jgi:hypothetical protein
MVSPTQNGVTSLGPVVQGVKVADNSFRARTTLPVRCFFRGRCADRSGG